MPSESSSPSPSLSPVPAASAACRVQHSAITVHCPNCAHFVISRPAARVASRLPSSTERPTYDIRRVQRHNHLPRGFDDLLGLGLRAYGSLHSCASSASSLFIQVSSAVARRGLSQAKAKSRQNPALYLQNPRPNRYRRSLFKAVFVMATEGSHLTTAPQQVQQLPHRAAPMSTAPQSAVSPPSKRELASWWKKFRKTAEKNEEKGEQLRRRYHICLWSQAPQTGPLPFQHPQSCRQPRRSSSPRYPALCRLGLRS